MPRPESPDTPSGSEEPQPDVIKGRPGYASFSMAALEERIIAQLEAEIGGDVDPPDEAAGRALVHDAGDYVLAVEAVPLAQREKAQLYDRVYRHVFSYDLLDDYLADETVTEIVVDTFGAIYVRTGSGEPQKTDHAFANLAYLRRLVARLVAAAGGQLTEADPFVEAGLILLDRPARLTVVGPPLSPGLSFTLRLHPRTPRTLDRLLSNGMITSAAQTLLDAIMRSRHGLLIVGDVAAGKTSLLEALLPALPDPALGVLIERAREIRTPAAMHHLSAIPATDETAGVTFGAQIDQALGQGHQTIVLDELRGDEAAPVWQVLQGDARCVFVVRSSPAVDRLRSTLNILIRRAAPAVPQTAIHDTLVNRLPFVVTLVEVEDALRVATISEWGLDLAADSLTLQPLLAGDALTGCQPAHSLDLPDEFWQG
jgi:pilus assembly protein CpaF